MHVSGYMALISDIGTAQETLEYEIGPKSRHSPRRLIEGLGGAIIEEIFIYTCDFSIKTIINTHRGSLTIDNHKPGRARNCRYVYSLLPNVSHTAITQPRGDNFWVFDITPIQGRAISRVIAGRDLIYLELEPGGDSERNCIQIAHASAYMPLCDYIGMCSSRDI